MDAVSSESIPDLGGCDGPTQVLMSSAKFGAQSILETLQTKNRPMHSQECYN